LNLTKCFLHQAEDDDDEEYAEHDESDRERFQGMLNAVGAFGRRVPSHSLPLLTKLLESRISSLNNKLHSLRQPSLSANGQNLSSLYEDLHWLILVACEFLAVAYVLVIVIFF
jgi:hypothetical protein